MKFNKRWALLLMSLALLQVGCGHDNQKSSGADPTDPDPVVPDTIVLTGKAVARPADVAEVASLGESVERWVAKLATTPLAWAAGDTGASDNEVLPDATVSLYKMFADGTETAVDIGTVTTDEEGDYSIEGIDPAPAGTGADTDFYYEVRMEKGDLQLRAPAAPTADGEVNVSPESNLAATVLSDVLDVSVDGISPLPSAALIDALREQTIMDAGALQEGGSIALPSAAAGEDLTTAMANGLAAAGGNTETLLEASAFNAERTALDNDDAASEEEAGAYLRRLALEACNQHDGDFIPQALAEAMGAYLIDSDATVSVSDMVTAYNANNSSGPDLVLGTVITALQTLVDEAQGHLTASAGMSTDIDNDTKAAMYVGTGDLTDISADTELTLEQAYLLAQLLGGGDGPAPHTCGNDMNLDIYGFVADMMGTPALKTARISDFSVYHNSGFGCNEGDGEGHFVASVDIYAAGKSITSVTLSSSDSTALDGDGSITLTSSGGSTYTSDADGVCVALGTNVTYTITANFGDSTTATREVARNHPRVGEADSQVLVGETFVPGAADSDSPTVVATTRPLYQWDSPDSKLQEIIDDAVNADVKTDLEASAIAVKYTYEFAHVNTTDSPVAPIMGEEACAFVSSGALYAVDSFLPTEDCDVTACAAALSTDPANISCRMNIQSYLVDANDSPLAQAAGHFRFFCVDTNGDDDCGE